MLGLLSRRQSEILLTNVAPPETTLENLSQRVEFLEDKIMDNLEIVRENQEKMVSDITKIKEAMYNPDAGLYARLKVVEEQRKNTNRLIWFLFTMFVGTVGAFVTSLLSK